MKCTVCNGSGEILEPIGNSTRKKRETARKLVMAGFSLREAGEFLGCSKQYVQYLLRDAKTAYITKE